MTVWGILIRIAVPLVIALGVVMLLGDIMSARADAMLVGSALVHDGDTITVITCPRASDIPTGCHRVRVRLWGVDAPELDEYGGQAARDEMKRIVGNDVVRCVDTGARSHDRIVGVCGTDTFPDIGLEIISRGKALDCPRYSHGRYHDAETAAARLTLPAKPYCRQH